MAVPKLLKSTPFLASSGVVGVGGTSVIIWQATGKGSSVPENAPTSDPLSISHSSITDADEEDEDSPSPAKVWRFDTDSTKDFSSSIDLFDSFNTSTAEGAISSSIRLDNNIFKLKTYRCFDKFFGLGSLSHDFLWLVQDSSGVSSILAETPNDISSDSLTGCSVMNLSHKDGNFLFRSEVVVKNDKFGLGLWTGLKGSKSDSNLSVNLVNYLLFFEKKGDNWSKSGGYAWGGKDHIFKTSSLTIKSPDRSYINKTFGTSDSGESSPENMNYFGVWESGGGDSGTELLNFDKQDEYYSNIDPFTFSLPFTVKISSNFIKGSYIVKSEGESRSWIQYDGSSVSSGVPDNVEKWSTLVKGKKGSWKSISDYCSGKNNLEESQRKENVCFLEEVKSNDT